MSGIQSQQHPISGRQGIRILFVWLSVLLPILCGTRAGAQERPLDELRRINEGVDALIKRVSPSVVQNFESLFRGGSLAKPERPTLAKFAR